MEPVEILISEGRDCARKDYIVEQGVPVAPLTPEQAGNLIISDEAGHSVPASIHPEGFDPDGRVRWLLLSIPVNLPANGQVHFRLQEGRAAEDGELICTKDAQRISVENRFFRAEFIEPGDICLSTTAGTLLEGGVSFDLRSDARSTVGGLRLIYYEPQGYEILEQTRRRLRLILRGKYRPRVPKSSEIDFRRGYEADVEFIIYADSPVIRLRWRITNFMRFNCPYMWLDRYVLSFPVANGSDAHGEAADGSGNLGSWASVTTSGGRIACAFPFTEWLGRGAGVEFRDGRMGMGGINPPPDGGFGGKYPEIWRQLWYGMSRSFEGSLLINPDEHQIQSELKPIPMVLSPQYYSDIDILPENGGRVTFGPWKELVERAGEHLLDTQWRGTLWFGEWWRERDVDHDLGIEETNCGNSALAPLYHFYRTGDWRYWESAKMSYYYTWDIQFCKQPDGLGPYMHTRRFLLDHQEWFHPRYQRVGGTIQLSHVLGDSEARKKTIWFLRYWAENLVADDGAPMVPNADGTKTKLTESAMSNLIDALIYGYMETGDRVFLESATRMGNWIVLNCEQDLDAFAGNSNSTRYILRGLLPLIRTTGDHRYKDIFVKLARWTVNSETFSYGTHYVAFHFEFASEAYKMSGARDILDGIHRLAEWVISQESDENPGTFPFLQEYQYPPARWICIYDNQAIVAYLPVLASTLAEAEEHSS